MRWLVVTATVVAALGVGMLQPASAQEPPPPPPPPQEAPKPPPQAKERNTAVPRAERAREAGERVIQRQDQTTREQQPVPQPPPPAVREPQPVARPGAVRREAVREKAPREVRTGDESDGRRTPTTTVSETPAAAATTNANEQGAERRGAVRRPPSGEGSGPGDRAVVRTGPPPNQDRDHDRVYVYPDYWSYGHYYSPYYYGGFHLGYLAYSPWGWTPAFYGYPYGYGYPGYAGGYYQAVGYDIGRVRLIVKPRDAEVWVDGYFAGTVDDFDGAFQSLRLDSGGYRIEIRKPGFDTLQFDVRVQPDRKITYRGELKPAP